MSTGQMTPEVTRPRAATRFDRRQAKILEHATAVFYKKGYEGASMRDLSRVTGLSLAGLYYYFESKEKLLYLIQKHYFTVVVERLRKRLEGVKDSEARVRAFILNHFEYFLAENYKATKVLSKEDDVLGGELGAEIVSLKRQYYHSCAELVDDLKREKGLDFNTRVAVLGLFGTMNWIYTWYKPKVDPDAVALARQVGDIFLGGVKSAVKRL
ncbi:MAG: TetR/AcrR family transcriptional regulator [Acidobacteriia bacterium]|nr:TetR/AcrR family transcriptional regulator [Terriglobia bacterium]